ncbi:MAG: hypothetical protein ABQ298_03695 [Puniceicoccaceae bacterium]
MSTSQTAFDFASDAAGCSLSESTCSPLVDYAHELFVRNLERINQPFHARKGFVSVPMEDLMGMTQILAATAQNLLDTDRIDWLEKHRAPGEAWLMTMQDGTRIKYGPLVSIRRCIDTAMDDYSANAEARHEA